MPGPRQDFWQQRFENGDIPWDRGAADDQLHRWLADGTITGGDAVLVPGCGRGWEVEALAERGLRVTGIDYAPAALAACAERLQVRQLHADLVEADVLHWQPQAPADVIYEQTCLCALHPDHWTAYAAQLHRWLRPGGRLAALFIQVQRAGAAQGHVDGPPYHVDINAARALFPSALWDWPAAPHARVTPQGQSGLGGAAELAVVLRRRDGSVDTPSGPR